LGHVGKVLEIVSDVRIRVEFPNGAWKFKKNELRLHGRFGLTVGDAVVWTEPEDGVDAGEVGSVVGFQSETVRVQFKNLVFSVPADQLEAPPCDDPKGGLEEGDAVTVTAEADGIKPGMRGRCLSFDDGSWTVRFDKSGDKEVPIESSALTLIGKCFEDKGKNGVLLEDWVTTSKLSEESIPKGSYGQVQGFTGSMAKVRFNTESFLIHPKDLTVQARKYVNREGEESWIALDDTVTWTSSDDDIPEGDIGSPCELRLNLVPLTPTPTAL